MKQLFISKSNIYVDIKQLAHRCMSVQNLSGLLSMQGVCGVLSAHLRSLEGVELEGF